MDTRVTVPFVGNLSVMTTSGGTTDIPLAGGHIFGYCLTPEDTAALLALKTGEPTEFKRKDGTTGKRLPLGFVKVDLEQVDILADSGEPIYRLASKPERAEDTSLSAFFG